MGSSPPAGNYYVLEIPMSSDSVFGGLPPDDTYLLRDPGKAIAGENANLYINNVLITTPELPYEIVQEAYVEMDIYAPSTQQYAINLAAGRNLISFPLQPQDTSRDVILAPILDKIISVWWLDPVIGWRWYKPGEPSNFGDVMEAGVGYWMNVTEDTSLIIQGTPPPTTIALNDGRNLVGYNLLEPKGIEAAMASIHPNYSKVWAFLPVFGWRWYDPANPGGSNLWELSPGMGIWLNSIGSQIWDVDP
jgi:hypothetical protein